MNGFIGVSADSNPTPALPPAGDRALRERVLLSAEIVTFGGAAATRHRVRDISATGARIDQAHTLNPGATVLVSVGLLDAVGATIIWREQDHAGLKFAQQIDPDAARSKAALPPKRASIGRC